MDVLVQAEVNRDRGAAKGCFVVTQSSVPVVSASEPWNARVEGHPMGLLRDFCASVAAYTFFSLWDGERGTPKGIYTTTQYCIGIIFLFLKKKRKAF